VSHSAILAFIGLLTGLAVPLTIGASALLTAEWSASALPEALLILFGGAATLVTALCAAFRRCAGTLFRGHALDTCLWFLAWLRVALIFEAGVVPVALRLLRRAVLVIALLRHCVSLLHPHGSGGEETLIAGIAPCLPYEKRRANWWPGESE
jgi:hypothetical protein